MKKNKLLVALIVCTFATSPVFAEHYDNVSGGNYSLSGTVEGNVAGNGGAVYNAANGSVTVESGALLQHNTATAASGGGVIFNSGGTVTVENSATFSENYLDAPDVGSLWYGGGAGGAISSYNSGNVVIKDRVKFIDNGKTSIGGDSFASGGALYSDTNGNDQAELSIGNSFKFSGNSATKAGAIYLGGTDATIGDGTLSENKATGSSGGAIYAFGGQTIVGGPDVKTVLNTGKVTLDSNEAAEDGGAIYNYASSAVTLGDGSELSNNHADGNGGAINNTGYYDRNGNEFYTASTTVVNGNFDNNSAGVIGETIGNGGAIYNAIDIISGNPTKEDKQNYAKTDVSGTFTNNSATGIGGAIYNDGKLTLTDAVFRDNSAQQGGAVYNTVDGYVSMEDVNFSAASENSDAKNDILNAGYIETSGNNTFNSAITNNGEIAFGGTADNVGGTLINNSTITKSTSLDIQKLDNKAGSSIIDTNGHLTVHEGVNNGEIVQKTFTVGEQTLVDGFENKSTITAEKLVVKENGDFVNNGDLNIANEIENAGSFENNKSISIDTFNNKDGGRFTGEGNLTISEEGNIEAGSYLEQNDITIEADSFVNDGELISNGVFKNSAELTGAGDLTVVEGSTTSKISQSNVIVKRMFNIKSTELEAKSITNNGTIKLENASTLTLTNQTTALDHAIQSVGLNNKLSLKNGSDNAKFSGSLDLTPNSSMDLEAGNIVNDAIVNVVNSSTLNIKDNSIISMGSNDNWGGKVTLNDSASMSVENLNGNGILVADSTGELEIKSGTLNIAKDSYIKSNVATIIDGDATLNIINGGNVSLDSNDTWIGKVVLGKDGLTNDASSLDVSGLAATGVLNANSGNLTLHDDNLSIGEGSWIKKEVDLTMASAGSTIKITDKGEVAINKGDTLNGAEIQLSEGGTLNYGRNYNDSQTDNVIITSIDGGNLNLIDDAYLTLKTGSNIIDEVNINITKDATVDLQDALTLNLDNKDSWNGKIINQNGTVNVNGLTKTSSTTALEQSNGDFNVYNDSKLILGSNSKIEGGEINITKGADGQTGSVLTVIDASITGGDMTIDKDSKFVLQSGNFNLTSLTASGDSVQAALVDVMNGQYTTSSFENVNIAANNQANFNIDVLARSNQRHNNDQFSIGALNGDGTLKINDWSLNGDLYGWDAPIDRHIKLDHVFVDNNGNPLEGNIEITDKTTFTPIGWYQLNKNAGAGSMNYTLDLVKYNPQVYRGQVATVAQWMNQLNVDDILFTHSMVLPSFKDLDGGTMANRYAAESPLFAPYQYSRKDGGLWYKAYGTFENLQMNNGLSRVGNNAYGVLIGADFGLKELKNGWKFMPTAYLGYNGAHQTFARMGQYQNGGQAGFLGTWYKDNFILGALAYGGIYGNSMDVRGFNDETFNYFAGAATKAAYNIRLHKDWVLQPNLFVSYNYFGQQNWHSKFGQMGMMAGDLNGVNIAPGLNLIWEKETFSAYATLQYMYNINGACGGRAGNVGLPQVEMERGYIQYGLGINKRFTDRASGYLQAVLRNVGRTGVGFQAGFNFMIGK